MGNCSANMGIIVFLTLDASYISQEASNLFFTHPLHILFPTKNLKFFLGFSSLSFFFTNAIVSVLYEFIQLY